MMQRSLCWTPPSFRVLPGALWFSVNQTQPVVPDPGCFPITQSSRISPGKLFCEPFSLVSKNSSFTYSQVSLCLISFPSSFFVPLLSTSINLLPGDTSWQMCQLALFRWETSVILSNVSSVSIIRELWGAWVTCLRISSHHLLLDWKKKKADCLGRTHSALISSNHISFLNFPHPFFHSIWRSILRDFKANQDFKANPHSPPNFNLSLSFPLLVCYFHITLSAWTSIKPTLSEHLSPCSIPWKAGLTGQPQVHHLPCLPQSSALWIPQLLCWNCSPSPQITRQLDWGPFLRLVL